jgi:hypothetical protein
MNQFYDKDKKVCLIVDRTIWQIGKKDINILTLAFVYPFQLKLF